MEAIQSQMKEEVENFQGIQKSTFKGFLFCSLVLIFVLIIVHLCIVFWKIVNLTEIYIVIYTIQLQKFVFIQEVMLLGGFCYLE